MTQLVIYTAAHNTCTSMWYKVCASGCGSLSFRQALYILYIYNLSMIGGVMT